MRSRPPIARRLGCDDLDANRIARPGPGHLAALFAARLAVRAYPAVMARRGVPR
ncbi:hypothetical protein [Kitasatospora sp. NPDC056531]|uniref:hypothetical protein n=1 Tax=Kitasatospora sp. NPDC056531 TaxID=3345856 RepID=UPI00367DCEA8